MCVQFQDLVKTLRCNLGLMQLATYNSLIAKGSFILRIEFKRFLHKNQRFSQLADALKSYSFVNERGLELWIQFKGAVITSYRFL
jgi:hypothetical protein